MTYQEQKTYGIFLMMGLFMIIVLTLSFIIGPMIFIRLILIYSIFLVMTLVSIYLSIYGPSKYQYRDADWKDANHFFKPNYDKEKWNVILDTHSHTNASDGKLSVEENVKYHISVGFNACVITDHNTMRNIDEVLRIKEKYKEQFILIPGVEYSTNRIHLCFIGIREWDCKKIPVHPTDEEIKDAIKKVHLMGGVVAVCHYPWSTWSMVGKGYCRMPSHPSREQIYAWGVDLIEAANWDDDISLTDPISIEFAKSHPDISCCCGTDMHEPFRHPLCGWTLLKAEKFTEQAIIEELRNHRTEILLIEPLKYPINHKKNPWYKLITPLVMWGKMFQEVYLWDNKPKWDISAIVAWLSYIFILFLILELFLFIIT